MKKLILIVYMIVAVIGDAFSCNVPVFRYALERWHPELFQIAFLYKDSLNNEYREMALKLKNRCTVIDNKKVVEVKADSIEKLNAEFHLVKVNGDVSDLQKAIWGKYMSDSLPKVIINFPLSSGIREPFWIGSPQNHELDAIYDSPVKNRITRSLLDGMTSVWVFIESGDKNKDDKAYKLLKEELRKNEKTLALPTLSNQDSSDYLSRGPELKIAFDLIRISRNDVAEENTVRMLEMIERPLVKMRNHPFAFPVFARGRALYVLVGDGINSKMITQANSYIAGPCACTVKAQNPGTDLLLIDCWEKSLKTRYVKEIQPPGTLFGLGGFLKKKESEKKAD